ncbi:MAG: deoxyribonuclease IV [Deltaproteobacteria bacterium]|nr:deoxyribonuclease IV [Deltaproteobacteria bacterium]
MSRYLGCHVSAAGGLENAIANGTELGVNTIQIHPSPPQRWNSTAYKAGFEAEFLKARSASKIKKVFFHAIYLINLATPDSKNFHLSKLSLKHYLELMHRIQGDGVIVHVGSLKDQEKEEEGLERAASGINWIFENTPGEARLLLEVAAGSGKVIGSRLEQLARVFELVENKERLGFALDSQHLWASGYDLRENLEGVLQDIKQQFGYKKVWAVHLNDSKVECASKKDRHENLGEGVIGKEALSKFVNHSELRSIPFILETPGLKQMDTAKVEVSKLLEMAR